VVAETDRRAEDMYDEFGSAKSRKYRWPIYVSRAEGSAQLENRALIHGQEGWVSSPLPAHQVQARSRHRQSFHTGSGGAPVITKAWQGERPPGFPVAAGVGDKAWWLWVIVAILAVGLPAALWALTTWRPPPAYQPDPGPRPRLNRVDRWLYDRYALPVRERWRVTHAVTEGQELTDPRLRQAAHGLAAALLRGPDTRAQPEHEAHLDGRGRGRLPLRRHLGCGAGNRPL
jgi:hypothetical protein